MWLSLGSLLSLGVAPATAAGMLHTKSFPGHAMPKRGSPWATKCRQTPGWEGLGQSPQMLLLSSQATSLDCHSQRSTKAAVLAHRFRCSIGGGLWHRHIEGSTRQRSSVGSANTLPWRNAPQLYMSAKSGAVLTSLGLHSFNSSCHPFSSPGSGSPAPPAFGQLFTVAITLAMPVMSCLAAVA